MSFSHVLNQNVNNNGTVVGSPQTFTGGLEANLDEVIPENQTDLELSYKLDVSQIQSILIEASADMTLETNNGDGGDESISLLAGQPLVWHVDSYYANLLATDLVSIFITNTTAGTLKIQCTVDPTPE
jgi:hypothetical protein